jgi:type I restriction enzyme R subunit
MSANLANEAGTVQFPLVKHAESAGWQVVSDTDGLTMRGGESGLFFYHELEEALLRLNPGFVTRENVNNIVQRMEAVPKTIEGNREILEWLRGNRTVLDEREKRHRNVTLVDERNLDRNVFQVTYEWSFKTSNRKGNRADVVFVLNGIPVAIVENKNPKLADAMERAVTQLRRYELETPELLTVPQVFNVTHLIEYFYGVTWSYSRKAIFRWKETEADQAHEPYRTAVQRFFDRGRFLTMLLDWILFYVKNDVLEKTVLRQHQTRAVGKVVKRCSEPARKTGLVWHTQGSGKTFTLITAARLILEDKEHFPGATVLLVVDRNELEGQLSGWVERIMGEMQGRQVKISYAESRAKLQELFDQDFRGLIVSMIHKFDGIRKDSCVRPDVFVLIDEAHRSTSGDLGNYLMGALPNATLIGFTGTPIDKTAYGKGTFKVFGKDDDQGYLDKYSIRESIEDGTTVKLRHMLAPGEICLPEDLLEREFLSLTEAEGVSDVEELNRILERAVTLRAFLKADDRLDKVARFVAKHFRENVEPLGYKAFLVAVDREACALYKKALDKYLSPEYSVPIYTKNAADTIDRPLVAKLQLDEAAEKKMRKIFPKPAENPKIFIVTDKLLTGYDAPVLYCMYLDKPMRDHVLLQAIARVNRPYEDEQGVKKPCGLIVDFVGILKELNKALAFDSDQVSGVIEDLDLLLVRFRELMTQSGRRYLDMAGGPGGNDEKLERLLYETFLEKEERQKFAEFFKELETLYEILSPSSELRDFIEDYNRLADIYVMLANAYGRKTRFYSDLAHKTERLVRESATAYGLDNLTKTVEFDETALGALRDSQAPDAAKVINLARALVEDGSRHGGQDPVLLGIAERAEAVLEAFTERQTSTLQALERLKRLMDEKRDLEEERKRTGFDPETFAIFWILRRESLEMPEILASEIAEAFKRFPSHQTNTDEMRQLKAEIYKTMLRVVSGRRMVDLAEQILRVKHP